MPTARGETADLDADRRSAAWLNPPGRDGGRVELLGFDPGRDRKRLRPLLDAQLQTSALPKRLRVGEALRLLARLAGARLDWRELCRAWRLESLEHQSFGSLSGGERQRLVLAVAMINQPRVRPAGSSLLGGFRSEEPRVSDRE